VGCTSQVQVAEEKLLLPWLRRGAVVGLATQCEGEQES
jgi:hypothetical protein